MLKSKTSNNTQNTTTDKKGMTTQEAGLAAAGIEAASQITTTAIDVFGKASDAIGNIASMGGVAIAQAVTGVITTIGTTITGIAKSAQEGATNRTAIVNDSLQKFFKIDTNKYSNVPFVAMTGIALIAMIFLKAQKIKLK